SGTSGALVTGVWQYPASISYDGTAVAFIGFASQAGFSGGMEILMRTLSVSPTTDLVSRANGPTGASADYTPIFYSLSSNANVVAFETQATNLDTDTDPEFRGVYVRNRSGNTTISPVKKDGSEAAFTGSGMNASYPAPGGVSADGRYVVFTSQSNALSAEDDDVRLNVFVRDTVLDTTTLVSRAAGAAGAAANGSSVAAGISADGTKVLFAIDATNLVDGPIDYSAELYIRNLVTNTTIRVTPYNS